MPATRAFDRRADDLGSIVALEHVNTTVPDQRLAALFDIEHEVRSLRHPLWGRAFVNRNPDQTQREYVPGRDAYAG